MKFEKFNYSTANVPNLKKKVRWSVVFSVLMISIILLEIILMVHSFASHDNLSIPENIATIFTLLFSLIFVLYMISIVARNMAIIKKIKQNGYTASDTLMYDFSSRTSSGNIFRLFQYIMLLICVIAVAGFVTYAIFSYIYKSTINYYIPLLLSSLIASYYSCKNVELNYLLQKG